MQEEYRTGYQTSVIRKLITHFTLIATLKKQKEFIKISRVPDIKIRNEQKYKNNEIQ